MRLGCLLPVLAIGLLWGGGQGIYVAAVSGKQQTISYKDFAAKKPGVGWYRITGCAWDIEDASFSAYKMSGNVDKVYLPIYDANAKSDGKRDPGQKTVLILETEREDLTDFVTTINKSEKNKEKPVDLPSAEALKNLVHFEGDLQGTVQFGLDASSKTRDQLAQMQALDPNYIILEDGGKPSLGAGIGMFVAGLVATLVWVFLQVRKRIGGPPIGGVVAGR